MTLAKEKKCMKLFLKCATTRKKGECCRAMIINKKYIIEMVQGNNGNISTRFKRLCKATQFLLKSYKNAISIAIFSSAWPQTHIFFICWRHSL